jgi:hypothetical protein
VRGPLCACLCVLRHVCCVLRQDGFEVLRITEIKLPEVRKLATQALVVEQDPSILSDAIGALRPAIAPESENTVILQQVQGFTGHSDPGVRAQSIRTLVGWDKTGASIPFIKRALVDVAPEVRSAAVLSIMDNRVRTDELKQTVMRIALNREESAGLRMNAVLALEHFTLSSEEYARVLQSAMEAEDLLKSSPDTGP